LMWPRLAGCWSPWASQPRGLRAVVLAVRNWLARGQGVRRTVRLEIGGEVLELSEATAAEQQRLVDLFVSRHAAGEGS
jgi:hypothetical protein